MQGSLHQILVGLTPTDQAEPTDNTTLSFTFEISP